MSMNTKIKAGVFSIGCLLLSSCGGGPPNESSTETTRALSAPPDGCLSEEPCASYPCSNGGQWWPNPGPISNYNQTPTYGTSTCPGYYILDILDSSTLRSGSAILSVAPTRQPSPCPDSSLNVYVYGHNADGWTALPELTTLLTPISVQGQCALSDVETNLGGLPQYDQLRVLAGGEITPDEVLPLTVQINGCIPKTCNTPGIGCGRVSNGCGGLISCSLCSTRPPIRRFP